MMIYCMSAAVQASAADLRSVFDIKTYLIWVKLSSLTWDSFIVANFV